MGKRVGGDKKKKPFPLFLPSLVNCLCHIMQCYCMAKYFLCAAPHVRQFFCVCKDSWPSILCVKGFKTAKEIIEHAALSL